MAREVWSPLEAEITIWEEEEVAGVRRKKQGGDPLATLPALLVASYVTDLRVEERVEINRRGQPGKSVKDRVVEDVAYFLKFSRRYLSKVDSLLISDRSKNYWIEASCVNPRYSGTGEEANDNHVCKGCVPANRGFGGSETDVSMGEEIEFDVAEFS